MLQTDSFRQLHDKLQYCLQNQFLLFYDWWPLTKIIWLWQEKNILGAFADSEGNDQNEQTTRKHRLVEITVVRIWHTAVFVSLTSAFLFKSYTVYTLNIRTPYYTCPKYWTSLLKHLLMCLKKLPDNIIQTRQFKYIQSNLVISNSLISNYRLSRSENLIPVLTWNYDNR